MGSAKADGRCSAINVAPIVVGISDVKSSLVLSAVAVRVADKRGFELSAGMLVRYHLHWAFFFPLDGGMVFIRGHASRCWRR
jgi:hypothetical protein